MIEVSKRYFVVKYYYRGLRENQLFSLVTFRDEIRSRSANEDVYIVHSQFQFIIDIFERLLQYECDRGSMTKN